MSRYFVSSQTGYTSQSIILFALGFFSSISIVQFAGVSIFLILIYLSAFIWLIRGRLIFSLDSPFLPFLLVATVSFFLSFFLNLPSGYILNNLKGIINLYAIYLVASTIISESNGVNCIGPFLKGLIWSCRFQVGWILVQTVSWNLLSIDINDLLFSQLLGFVEDASQFKGTG